MHVMSVSAVRYLLAVSDDQAISNAPLLSCMHADTLNSVPLLC